MTRTHADTETHKHEHTHTQNKRTHASLDVHVPVHTRAHREIERNLFSERYRTENINDVSKANRVTTIHL